MSIIQRMACAQGDHAWASTYSYFYLDDKETTCPDGSECDSHAIHARRGSARSDLTRPAKAPIRSGAKQDNEKHPIFHEAALQGGAKSRNCSLRLFALPVVFRPERALSADLWCGKALIQTAPRSARARRDAPELPRLKPNAPPAPVAPHQYSCEVKVACRRARTWSTPHPPPRPSNGLNSSLPNVTRCAGQHRRDCPVA